MTSAAEDKCLNIRAEVRLNGKELQGNALFRPALAALCTGQGRVCNSISGGTGPSCQSDDWFETHGSGSNERWPKVNRLGTESLCDCDDAPGAGASLGCTGWDRNPRPSPVINHWQRPELAGPGVKTSNHSSAARRQNKESLSINLAGSPDSLTAGCCRCCISCNLLHPPRLKSIQQAIHAGSNTKKTLSGSHR